MIFTSKLRCKLSSILSEKLPVIQLTRINTTAGLFRYIEYLLRCFNSRNLYRKGLSFEFLIKHFILEINSILK